VAEPLVVMQPPGSTAGQAQALLATTRTLEMAVPEDGAFSVWARGESCAEAVWLARELPERVTALVLEAPTSAPEAADLAELTVPTLVACGTDAANGTADAGRTYREHMPSCHFVLVYATGDDIANQRPGAFVSLVEDFLERRERFIVNQRSGLLHP